MEVKKLYVIRKYIKAVSAAEAIKLEKHAEVDAVWIGDEWLKNNTSDMGKIKMGYHNGD